MANKKQNYDIIVYTAITAKSTKKLPEPPEIILFEIFGVIKRQTFYNLFKTTAD